MGNPSVPVPVPVQVSMVEPESRGEDSGEYRTLLSITSPTPPPILAKHSMGDSRPVLIPDEVQKYVEHLREKYNVASIGVAVVSTGKKDSNRREKDNDGAQSQVFCVGDAATGRALDQKVRRSLLKDTLRMHELTHRSPSFP